jgi:hypothetical protein
MKVIGKFKKVITRWLEKRNKINKYDSKIIQFNMTEIMLYENGNIYKIISDKHNECFIGYSTNNTLKQCHNKYSRDTLKPVLAITLKDLVNILYIFQNNAYG